MSQPHTTRGTDSPQNTTQEEESQQAELANTIWSNRVRNEAIGVSRNLHRPVPSHCANAPNFNFFFFLNYPFTAWGVAASRAQHLAKSFIPPSIPTIPARMKTHITADSKKARATSSRQQKSLGHRMKPRAQFLDKNEERVGDNNDSIKMLFLTHNSCTFIQKGTGLSVHPSPWN